MNDKQINKFYDREDDYNIEEEVAEALDRLGYVIIRRDEGFDFARKKRRPSLGKKKENDDGACN